MSSVIDSPYEGEVVTPADLDQADFNTVSDLPERTGPSSAHVAAVPEREVVRRVHKPALNTFVVENAGVSGPVKIQYKTYNAVAFRQRPGALRIGRTEYPQALETAQEPRQQLEASVKVPSTKKRGFFGKSLKVITKPYDWLKAVGSAFK